MSGISASDIILSIIFFIIIIWLFETGKLNQIGSYILRIATYTNIAINKIAYSIIGKCKAKKMSATANNITTKPINSYLLIPRFLLLISCTFLVILTLKFTEVLWLYILVLIASALLLAMIIVDLCVWLLSKSFDCICDYRTNKRKESYHKVRDTYYIKDLYQWINTCGIIGKNFIHNFGRGGEPRIQTPNQGYSERTEKNYPKNLSSNLPDERINTINERK